MSHCRRNRRSSVLYGHARDHRCCGLLARITPSQAKSFCCLRHQTHVRLNDDKEISDEDLTNTTNTAFNQPRRRSTYNNKISVRTSRATSFLTICFVIGSSLSLSILTIHSLPTLNSVRGVNQLMCERTNQRRQRRISCAKCYISTIDICRTVSSIAKEGFRVSEGYVRKLSVERSEKLRLILAEIAQCFL